MRGQRLVRPAAKTRADDALRVAWTTSDRPMPYIVGLLMAMPIRIRTAEDVNGSLSTDAHGLVVQSGALRDSLGPRRCGSAPSSCWGRDAADSGHGAVWLHQMRGREDAEFSSSSPGSGSTAALNAAIASRSVIKTRRAASTEGPAFDASKSS